MAVKPDTPIPGSVQPARYARAMPIGQVVHNLITDLAKKVGK